MNKVAMDIDSASEQTKFFVPSGDVSFANRQKDVFAELNKLEDAHTQFQHDLRDTVKDEPEKDDDDEEEQEQEKDCDSNFKRPSVIRSHRRRPDFARDPRKWTKYSLADVKNDDISDKANTSAAMDFLQECHKRKLSEAVAEDDDIVEDDERVNEAKCRSGSKWVMPEYVIGKPKKKVTAKPKGKVNSVEKVVSLSHLDDEDAEDDDSKDSNEKNFKEIKQKSRAYRKPIDEEDDEI